MILEGERGKKKAYVLYTCENVDNLEQPLRTVQSVCFRLPDGLFSYEKQKFWATTAHAQLSFCIMRV